MNRFCIPDSFVGLPSIVDWEGALNAITLLEAGTFVLKNGSNIINMDRNGLDTVEEGTFVLPDEGEIIDKTYSSVTNYIRDIQT